MRVRIRKKEKGIFDVFFRTKPTEIIIALSKQNKNKYGSVLAKEVNCTYSHAVKILHEMEKAKLIQFEKEGRIKTIFLTDQGHALAEQIERIKGTF